MKDEPRSTVRVNGSLDDTQYIRATLVVFDRGHEPTHEHCGVFRVFKEPSGVAVGKVVTDRVDVAEVAITTLEEGTCKCSNHC